jgi:hypothetical protein
MEVTFKTSDPIEAKRLAKADDMAVFIFSIIRNLPRKFEDSDTDHQPVFDAIYAELDRYNICIDDILE